ncbi:exosortase family protein XrtF [uncultured Nonlabens sp.]|uniref:exosortase family protein XrtF n=1 Tax=uncultured Nonlabens sp. TaxID=859306 RepID=UPI00260DBFC3|nr:exosortase family protein XrtF [uncultured Nonlabens sp.]
METLKPYYSIFKFVAVFFGIYILLSISYYLFLNMEWSSYNYPDPITSEIGHQTKELLNSIGIKTDTINSPTHPSVILFINEVRIYRIIEGCNAVSVMILFISFIIAFAQGLKKTFLFILMGTSFIYIVNLIRLVLLALIYVSYKDYAHFAHEIIFPTIIYGAVIILWLYWIKNMKNA